MQQTDPQMLFTMNSTSELLMAAMKKLQHDMREMKVLYTTGSRPEVAFAKPGIYESVHLKVGSVFSPVKVCGSIVYPSSVFPQIPEASDYIIAFMDCVEDLLKLRSECQDIDSKYVILHEAAFEIVDEMTRIINFVFKTTEECELGYPKPLRGTSYFPADLYREGGVLGLCQKLVDDIDANVFSEDSTTQRYFMVNTCKYFESLHNILCNLLTNLAAYLKKNN